MYFRFSICDFRFETVANPATCGVALPKSQITNHKSQIPSGFTLVEMLVVIGIIAILLGLGLMIGPEVFGRGNKQLTYALLKNCQSILAEYQIRVGSPVNNFGTTPIDWSSAKSETYGGSSHSLTLAIQNGNVDQSTIDAGSFYTLSIEQFVYATYSIDAIKNGLYASAAMKNGNDSLLGDVDGNGMLDLVDAWGNKIVYVAGNTGASDASTSDNKLPYRATPYFASAGPDGKWGDSHAAAGTTTANYAADNLYSYDAQ